MDSVQLWANTFVVYQMNTEKYFLAKQKTWNKNIGFGHLLFWDIFVCFSTKVLSYNIYCDIIPSQRNGYGITWISLIGHYLFTLQEGTLYKITMQIIHYTCKY